MPIGSSERGPLRSSNLYVHQATQPQQAKCSCAARPCAIYPPTIQFNIAFMSLLGALIAYQISLIIYRLFFHPPVEFPESRLAAATRLWEFYHDSFLCGQGGRFTFKLDHLHKRYGAGRYDDAYERPFLMWSTADRSRQTEQNHC